MKSTALRVLSFLVLLFAFASPAFAQTYAFSLDEEIVHVYWQSDGTLSLDYTFVFTNAGYADPLDVVDVGLPTDNFSYSNVTAWVYGYQVYGITSSPYVEYGFAVYLSPYEIQPSATGTVQVHVDGIRDVLYVDSTDDAYASAVFSPTWFGSEFVTGFTDLSVIYHLPPGVQPNEPRWHRPPSGFPESPATGFDNEGRITYTWRNTSATGYTQYLFGASFPASYVPAGAIATPSIWQRLGISIDWSVVVPVVCIGGFWAFWLFIIIAAVRAGRKRKLQYLPPRIAIEGHGPKRGLTAVEAAILLEQPMDKILTMILFAAVKKGAATVTKKDPLELDVAKTLPDDLRSYEKQFVEAFARETKPQRRRALQDMMIDLVKTVSSKMKGFSRKETQAFYRDIMQKAWAQVEAAGTPEVRSEKYDEVMEWTMLDDNYDDRTQDVFRRQTVYVPTWWHRYDPTYSRPITTGGGRSGSAPGSRPTPGGAGLPHLPGSDFAASVVSGVQNFAAGVIGSVSDFTSGVTNKTNPVPVVKSSGSRSGGSSGGSSCACACACAGCACACAGGGR